jgi:hypothetical protein
MKTKEQLSDNFLEDVVSILELGNFRFTRETRNTKIDVSSEVKVKLKQLCQQNRNERIKYNELHGPNITMHTEWPYNVMSGYFNLYL